MLVARITHRPDVVLTSSLCRPASIWPGAGVSAATPILTESLVGSCEQ